MSEQAKKQQQESAWVRAQFQKANKHMAEKGVLPGKVILKESRNLPPFVAIWKIEDSTPHKRRFWVLTGDLPTDMVSESAAPNAREAIHHFSLLWQMKAENLLRSRDKTQVELAKMMVSRSESLNKMHADQRLWGEMKSKLAS
ncbi:DUF4826 family protein [Ferrimonas lipolytica]|uniref:DUF4826 family protein n=1 Tax=Ferrimonas lipolytica TaxID=2724191 RepID=A0A6H1UCA4_9GAMM|nr:DUF4826 family protein [Ferrimonas lipolytica]QIZ76674.1 DUF4826 family protein [Ferrimonas lipolytica]